MYFSPLLLPFYQLKDACSQLWQYFLSLWAPPGPVSLQLINLFICSNIYIFQLFLLCNTPQGKILVLKSHCGSLISLQWQDSGFNQLILVTEQFSVIIQWSPIGYELRVIKWVSPPLSCLFHMEYGTAHFFHSTYTRSKARFKLVWWNCLWHSIFPPSNGN